MISDRLRRTVPFMLVLMLAMALCLRLALAAASTNRVDLDYYERWARAIAFDGIGQGYLSAAVDYPPLYLYMLWPVSLFYHRFVSPEFALNTPALNFLLRLPSIPFDIATAAVIYFAWRSREGISERRALWASALYAFNPGVIFVTAWWGQTDSIYTFLAVLTVLALERKHWGAAWALSAAGGLLKHQYIFILPLLLGVTLKEGGWRGLFRGVLWGGAVALIILIPFLPSAERLWAVIRVYTEYGSYTPFFAVNVSNFWYVVTLGQFQWSYEVLDTRPFLMGLSYRATSLIVYAAVSIWIAWQAVNRRAGKRLSFPAAVLAMTLFMIPTQVHERYMFPVFAFLALEFLDWPDLGVHYLLLAATYYWNVSTVLDSKWALGKAWLGPINLGAAMVNTLLYAIQLGFCAGHRSLAGLARGVGWFRFRRR